MISWSDFEKLEIRCGTVMEAGPLEGARKPAIKLKIDFGPFGIKHSSAQITDLYQPETLIGKQLVAVVNFPPKQVGKFISECLVLGAVDPDTNQVVILTTERPATNGHRIS